MNSQVIVVALGTDFTSNKASSKSESVNPVPVGRVTASNKIISPTSAPWAVDVVMVNVVVPSKVKVAEACSRPVSKGVIS